MQTNITIDQLKKAVPKAFKNKVDDDMVNSINGLMQDQSLRQNYRDNLLSYTSVLTEGKYRLGDYINAVRYVSFRLLGSNIGTAYAQTFPDRIQRLIDENTEQKTIASYCTAYSKTQLVQKISAQTITPSHILNNDIYQRAINKQAMIMMDDEVSPAVQQKAADSLMTHLKAPETVQMEIDIGIKDDKIINTLRETTKLLAEQQKKAIELGNMKPLEVAHSKLTIINESGEIEDE